MDTDGVILAGGYSSRAETFKMELILGDKPILARVIEAFYPYCNRIYVVGGYKSERLLPIIKPYLDKVKLIVNEKFDQGMFSSVKAGVRAVGSERFLLTPGDYPFIDTKICEMLLAQGVDVVIPKVKNRGGHPVLLPKRCINEILEEEDTSNLKEYLKKQDVKYIEIDNENILIDIDTKEDYEWAKSLINHKLGE